MSNGYLTFGIRGWSNGNPSEDGYYIVQVFEKPEPRINDFEDARPDNRYEWRMENAVSIVMKSYFNQDDLRFIDIPDNFLVAGWLDETPVIMLDTEETSDEFYDAWHVHQLYPFNRDMLIKLLSSCTKEQANIDEEKRIEECNKYKREQAEQLSKLQPKSRFKAPDDDNHEF